MRFGRISPLQVSKFTHVRGQYHVHPFKENYIIPVIITGILTLFIAYLTNSFSTSNCDKIVLIFLLFISFPLVTFLIKGFTEEDIWLIKVFKNKIKG